MMFFRKFFFLFYFVTVSVFALDVVDDSHRTVTLKEPAKRIISAAPHITEFLYEIGAGEKIVGVTEYSNYPVQAKKHPRIGNHHFIDTEKVLLLKPDLLIAWKGGNPARQIEKLEKLKIPVFYTDIRSLSDIGTTFIRLGILSGEDARGREKAMIWQKRLQKLQNEYKNKMPVKVFYQISERPLYTAGGKYIISEGIQLCGGQNIFSATSLMAPRVGIEEVLKRNPDVIFISDNMETADSYGIWHRFRLMEAVKNENVYKVNPDLLERPGPRFLDGLTILCEKLEAVRQK